MSETKYDTKTTPGHIDREIMKEIRKFVAENGGSIRKVLEHGAIWVMSKGSKEYIKSIADKSKN